MLLHNYFTVNSLISCLFKIRTYFAYTV